jgi:excisionase family DNA binding protein
LATRTTRLLTVAEVAARLGVSKGSVYRYITSNRLPATRLGDGLAPLRVSERELDSWLEDNRTRPPEAA